MRLQHVGTYIFGGSLSDLAAIGAPATADSSLLKKSREESAAEEKRNRKAEKNKKYSQ